MRFGRIRIRRLIWVALLAAAANALSLLASYPSQPGAAPTVEVCAAKGSMGTMPLPGGPDDNTGHASHCWQCCTASAKLLVLPTGTFIVSAGGGSTTDVPSADNALSPDRLFFYLPAHPRAPPRSLLA
jgi:hypothetical protein